METSYIPRLLEEQVEKTFSNQKVLFLLGARQVGKTTLVNRLLSRHEGRVLNMDIESDRARLLDASHLEPKEAVRALGGKDVLVIDEAHRVKNIGRICKGWYDDHVKPKIILLGSSSATLLSTAAAELTGRNEKLWLTPLLLREIIEQQEWFYAKHSAQKLQQAFPRQVKALLSNRLVFGSYPEAYLSVDPAAYLENLGHDYLLKDMFTTAAMRSPMDIRRLLSELAGNIGVSVSVLELATRLKLNRATVEKYLDLLEGIFVIFSLPAFATNRIKEVHRSRKYYFWDNGVMNSLHRLWTVSDRRVDVEQLWQNWVMAEIFKQSRTFNRHEELFFWQSRNGSTVDLIVREGEKLHAFDMRFDAHGYAPSRAFKNMYGFSPIAIHPANVLEYIL